MRKVLLLLSALLWLASCENARKNEVARQYEEHSIDLPGVPNSRQLGGYVIGDKKVRTDVLLRSGALAKASDEAIEALHDRHNLALVADFRTSFERAGAPDRDVEGARNVWFPVLENVVRAEGDASVMMELHLNKDNPAHTMELLGQPSVQGSLRGSYDTIVFDEDSQRSYAAFLDSLVTLPEGRAALWHCSHGKDRCGWGTAFVLAALGADRSLIVRDFAMSNISYTKDIEELASIARNEGQEKELKEYILLLRGVSATYFEKTLDEIDASYGSFENFLEKELDLSPEEKQVLKDKFLEDL